VRKISQIISAYPKELIEAELKKVTFVRPTNNGGNEIYIFKSHESETLMREVGRLREISFRDGGGGSGKSCDIDEFDGGDRTYTQLVVWDPEEKILLEVIDTYCV